MIETSPFHTRARTVDHLGREQIADCPTAISELWKNSFDAYARNVQLNIYDGEEPAAVIVDDGHGMNRDQFLDRWLVIGTETKATPTGPTSSDRSGLRIRQRQGQKGIGRLSSANLGPILLLVSKRKRSPFVASLVDWRLFENPFINLSDIFIPVVEFSEADQLFVHLPGLVTALLENIEGGSDKQRKKRICKAWESFDQLQQESKSGEFSQLVSSTEVLTTISRIPFNSRHLEQWPVWTGASSHGTALLISGINYDLRVHLDEKIADASAQAAKSRFFETLSSFVDPFVDPADPLSKKVDPQFSYVVQVWEKNACRMVLGAEKQFDKRQVDGMEHRIEGEIDSKGIFTGRVKAFGEWLPEDCKIEPPQDLSIPHRRDTHLGPFELYIASMEFTPSNTTHSESDFQRYKELAEKYSGFMVFRDGLRVLPYGRTDNDFFEIESRRSKSVGREFWNHRQMFGRLAITRKLNPNLKDKAGREGLLDNRAAKTLKELVANILMRSARLYFGSASDIRKELLPQISAENKRKRAAEARDKLQKRHRKEFRLKLKSYSQVLPEFVRDVKNYVEDLNIKTELEVSKAQRKLEEFQERLTGCKLSSVPKKLGSLEKTYVDYRVMIRDVEEAVSNLSEMIDNKLEEIELKKPRYLLEKQMASLAAQIHQRVREWSKSIDVLQKDEHQRIRKIVQGRKELFGSEAQPLLYRFDREELSYMEASKQMSLLKQRVDEENNDLFVPYIGALESLRDSIDLEHLATYDAEEIGDLREELDRLNGLAQLGIAVEIVGHELQSYDDIIGSGLDRLPKKVRTSQAAKDIEFGYEGLTDQLRFLSPLRLAGRKVQQWISGGEIVDYLSEFFRYALVKNHISLRATDKFRKLRVFDQRSRLYPVFINLLNNSIYWLGISKREDRQILLEVIGMEVVVSDNGPGIDPEDVSSLFSLFFTRKIRGGRGVGLYLCRSNLAAGGHRIRYEKDENDMPLGGANFVISFRGAEFDGE
ncbi:MAG: ATP-binding protein [Gammaproteobacteria bacterium]|nr:ATP-binding protein [Gammaproteobacteria bacterium]